MLSATFLSLLLVTLSSASPHQLHTTRGHTGRHIERDFKPVILSFNHEVKSFLGSTSNIAQFDRARANGFMNAAQTSSNGNTVGAGNTAMVYTAQIGVGSPPTQYTLLIDTGSSNTWVGAGKKYVKTGSSKQSSGSVSVSYGSGSFSGTEYTDSVTLAPSLTVQAQSIGVANKTTGFDGYDGILGIGPIHLTEGTVSNMQSVPTVTDNLAKAGMIPSEMLGIFFKPATSTDGVGKQGEGELSWGGVDTTRVTGNVNYAPLTTTSPANNYWGVNQTITYGSKSLISNSAGIVDTGTTLLLLATDAFRQYQSATGATMDKQAGLLKISSSQYSALQNLNIQIGGQTYSLSPNAQIWPRSLNSKVGGDANSIYLVVGDLGTHSGQGLDSILGYAFLERFYSVFDTSNHRVGFAQTQFTTATTN